MKQKLFFLAPLLFCFLLSHTRYSKGNDTSSNEKAEIGLKENNYSTATSAAKFYAVCEEKFPVPSHHSSLGWCGTQRATKAEAEEDVKKHNEKFKGHKALACINECPTCE